MDERLHILVVEDTDEKFDRISTAIERGMDGISYHLQRSISYTGSIHELQTNSFDVVVLDLVIPLNDNSSDKSDNYAIELLSNIRSGTSGKPMHVVGLTQHANVAENRKVFFEENLFALVVYSDVEFEWAERLLAKLRYIAQARLDSFDYRLKSFDYDLVVVCAVREREFNPIVKEVSWQGPPAADSRLLVDTPVRSGRIEIGDQTLRAAFVCANDMGIAHASSLVSNVVTVYRPRVLAMLGMCCGFNHPKCISPSKIGDIIVVRETACWQEGRYSEDANGRAFFQNRSRPMTPDTKTDKILSRLIKNASDDITPFLRQHYKQGVRSKIYKTLKKSGEFKPEVKYGMMLSGSGLVASHMQVSTILKDFPSAIALDMEMYGVFVAAKNCVGACPSVIGIKGVADHGTKAKNKKAQTHVSVASYLVLEQILKSVL